MMLLDRRSTSGSVGLLPRRRRRNERRRKRNVKLVEDIFPFDRLERSAEEEEKKSGGLVY